MAGNNFQKGRGLNRVKDHFILGYLITLLKILSGDRIDAIKKIVISI